MGSVIRLRSVRLKNQISAGNFELEPTSQTNLLLFQPYMKQSIEISERVIDDDMLRELINEATSQNMILAKPKVVTSLCS